MERPTTDTLKVLAAAYRAWDAGAALRAARQRNKKFTYGRQLDDIITLQDGRRMTEREAMTLSGKEPLTNNLMRQLVKSVVGRFREIDKERAAALPAELERKYAQMQLAELDSRAMEEFLISGTCIQKVERMRNLNSWQLGVENVNPDNFFINAITSPLASDCEIIGELHDMSVAEMIMRLAPDDRNLAGRIRTLYSGNVNMRTESTRQLLGFEPMSAPRFWTAVSGKCRVIEVWTRESREVYKVSDHKAGSCRTVPATAIASLQREQRKRERNGDNSLELSWYVEQYWRCRWITPMGDEIVALDSPFSHHSHPYAVKMYPLTDGEVHAFVEDVIDQQKYVNRLISLIDHVMSASAKGVLLYPTDALPTGFTWDELQRRWSSPSGVIPFDSDSHDVPRQISSSASNIGAYELLSLEMKLFDEISGVSGTLRGRDTTAGTGAELYREQTRNSTIVLNDIFCTFAHFQSMRDALLLSQ